MDKNAIPSWCNQSCMVAGCTFISVMVACFGALFIVMFKNHSNSEINLMTHFMNCMVYLIAVLVGHQAVASGSLLLNNKGPGVRNEEVVNTSNNVSVPNNVVNKGNN